MEGYQVMTLCFVLITGSIGIILNGSFVALTVTHSVLRQKYSWFFCGLASLNFIYCLNNAVCQAVVLILNVDGETNFCSAVSVVIVSTAIGSVCMQSCIALQRFVGLLYKSKLNIIFSTRNIVITLCCVILSSLLLTVISWSMGDMGRIGGTICGPNISIQPISHMIILQTPLCLSYLICIFCGYKIKRMLQDHENNMRRNDIGSTMQDARQIIKLIIIELVVPIGLEAPFLLCGLLSTKVNIHPMLIAISVCLFLIHAVIDPIIIVVVMKPYRNVLQKMGRQYQGKIVPTTVMVTGI